jgi:short-subunit dehydrogenase
MVAAKKGTIIMIPGILGKHVMKNSSIYSASKFAVSGFAKALVEEHRRNGIKVSLLYLGGVATPFWENPEIGMRVQADKMLTADEVAKAIYYACSQPESSVLNEIVMQPESHQLI